MKKTLTVLLAVTSVLVIAALAGVVFAQNGNPQTIINAKGQVNCVNDNVCLNENNGTCKGNCAENSYCQTQQSCIGYQANNQKQQGIAPVCGFQRGCR
ncbi:MAG: hypothetical protein ACFCUE_00360 [Candidatus Bathyarchaeia archaeon]